MSADMPFDLDLKGTDAGVNAKSALIPEDPSVILEKAGDSFRQSIAAFHHKKDAKIFFI